MEDSNHRQVRSWGQWLAKLGLDGWERVKRLMEGKRLVSRDDDGMVLMDGGDLEVEEGILEKAEWDEKVMGGLIEVEEESRSEDRTEEMEEGEDNRWGGTGEFGFLENMEIEEKDRELDARVGEGRKRKRDQDEEGPQRRN